MKFGVNTFIWADHFGEGQFSLLPPIKQAGFDGVEIPLLDPVGLPAAEIRRALADNGLACTFCSVLPPGLNTIADDGGVRRKTIEHWTRCMEVAAEIGGTIIAGPLYSPVGYLPGRRRTTDEWQHAVECFSTLGPALEQHNITLAIEPLNRFETYFLNTAADAVQLCREIAHPRVGILFDTFHANIEEKSVADALLATRGYLRHFHSCENDRGTPGTGHVEWRSVMAALRELGYDGWLTIESFGFTLGPLSAAAAIWRDLARTPESIAFEGVRFLRKLTAEAWSAKTAG